MSKHPMARVTSKGPRRSRSGKFAARPLTRRAPFKRIIGWIDAGLVQLGERLAVIPARTIKARYGTIVLQSASARSHLRLPMLIWPLLASALLATIVLTPSACASNPDTSYADASRPGAAPIHRQRPSAPEVQANSVRPGLGHHDNWAREAAKPSWPRRPFDTSGLDIRSASALIVDSKGGRLYGKNTRQVRPIASLSKLMTAMVVLDSDAPLDEPVRIVDADRDRLRNSRSRLRIGEAVLTRGDLLRAALMSSDNRAAHALARTTFRGGTPDFIRAMNFKADVLGMRDTYFADSSGLDARNRSTAEDLVKMARAASQYPLIRTITSNGQTRLKPFSRRPPLLYRNTNPLVRDPEWEVQVSKTGFINEAGRCLIMETKIGGRTLDMVFLGAQGHFTPMADSKRTRAWLLDQMYARGR